MDGYDVKRWERVQERVKELDLTMTISGSTIEINRTDKNTNPIGFVFQSVQDLSWFLDGYSWGKQPPAPKVVEKVQAKRGPKPKAKPVRGEHKPTFDTTKFEYYKGVCGTAPADMPDDCEWFNHLDGQWLIETVEPDSWGGTLVRRWPKPKAKTTVKGKYVMWKGGDAKPRKLPEGCEWQQSDNLKRYPEEAEPELWGFLKRRWPKGK